MLYLLYMYVVVCIGSCSVFVSVTMVTEAPETANLCQQQTYFIRTISKNIGALFQQQTYFIRTTCINKNIGALQINIIWAYHTCLLNLPRPEDFAHHPWSKCFRSICVYIVLPVQYLPIPIKFELFILLNRYMYALPCHYACIHTYNIYVYYCSHCNSDD